MKAFLGKLRAHNDIRVLYGPFNNDFVEQIITLGKTETVIGDVAKIVHDLSVHSAQNLQNGLIDIVGTQTRPGGISGDRFHRKRTWL